MVSSIRPIKRCRAQTTAFLSLAILFVLVIGGSPGSISGVGTEHGSRSSDNLDSLIIGQRIESSDGVTRWGGRASESPPTSTLRLNARGRLPFGFEANRGQVDSEVKFLSRGRGYALFLTSTEAALALGRPGRGIQNRDSLVLRMKLIGANRAPQVDGVDEQLGTTNYFIGNDSREWRKGISNYARVAYRNVYPGVDLIYHGTEGQLEYDFVVEPGSSPEIIRLAFEGAEKVDLNQRGELVLQTADGVLRQHRPHIYQNIDGERVEVEGQFKLISDHAPLGTPRVGFQVENYAVNAPLVIDPTLTYSTYLGGRGDDEASDVAVDDAGNVYVVGSTTSLNFPTTNPQQSNLAGDVDTFITKLNSAGAIVYSTYLGGRSADLGWGIAVDAAGNAYVVGITASFNFPTVNSVQSIHGGGLNDAFVAKLDATGSALLYSTYLGGSGEEQGLAIAVDPLGNAYVGGRTTSTNFLRVNALQGTIGGGEDGFITKLSSTGTSIGYSTYLGGKGDDLVRGIAVDGTGSAYVTGRTSSTNFPAVNALQPRFGGGIFDAYVAKLSPSGTGLAYSSYLGGRGEDQGSQITVDANGNAYTTGLTASSDFPTANAFQSAYSGGICGTDPGSFPCGDAYITKLDRTGTVLVYSTYLGGNRHELGVGIAVDAAGNAYVSGLTGSSNFPTANPLQATFGGGGCGTDIETSTCFDGFVAKLNPTGSMLVYSTFLGGARDDRVFGLGLDAMGNAYVAGFTNSLNFPMVNAFQLSYGGGPYDAFVAKIADK